MKTRETWTLTPRISLTAISSCHFLRSMTILVFFRGQSTTGCAFIGSTIRHSRHPMIRSTATKISSMLRSSRTFGSWVRDKRNFLKRSTWKTLRKMDLWCFRRGQWHLLSVRLKLFNDFFLDFIGFFISCCSFCFQSTHRSSTGTIPFKQLFL